MRKARYAPPPSLAGRARHISADAVNKASFAPRASRHSGPIMPMQRPGLFARIAARIGVSA